MTNAELRALRMRHKLTQAYCAGVVGVEIRAWQRWEEGTRRMRPIFEREFLRFLESREGATCKK
ncbi:hypothetical protein CARN8_1420005 [mine drainage metagenome]|uniref:HTH cro/C1-type domain-containing protein n=1 Tax=mine drainage metagenome TaxID=410659 RepID=A0A3P3ZLM0_9ZZZZ